MKIGTKLNLPIIGGFAVFALVGLWVMDGVIAHQGIHLTQDTMRSVLDSAEQAREATASLHEARAFDMKALSGTPAEKACAVVAAGCDAALDCWARMGEMVEMANALPDMSARSRARLDAAMATISPPKSVEKIAALIDKRDALLSYAA